MAAAAVESSRLDRNDQEERSLRQDVTIKLKKPSAAKTR